MITAVLIDDEYPALRGLQSLLKKHADIEVLGMFINPYDGMQKIREAAVDIVFLDINMPLMGGVEAATLVYKASPETEIVFVTAYEEYAVKAFELSVFDYLLKPVDAQRLEMTLEKLRKKKQESKAYQMKEETDKLTIRCLGGFEIGFEGAEPIRWRAEKTKELFAYLLHSAHRDLTKDEILDALWRQDNPNKAVKQLYNGIYYIRKALADYGIDQSRLFVDGDYHLHLGEADLDVSRFYTLYKQESSRSEALAHVLELYTGDYLGTLPYDWAVLERQHLLEMFVQCAIELAGLYVADERYDDAAEVLKKAYRHDPLSQSVTKHLLMLYNKTQNKSAAAQHYSLYCALLEKELGIEPSESIRGLVSWL